MRAFLLVQRATHDVRHCPVASNDFLAIKVDSDWTFFLDGSARPETSAVFHCKVMDLERLVAEWTQRLAVHNHVALCCD